MTNTRVPTLIKTMRMFVAFVLAFSASSSIAEVSDTPIPTLGEWLKGIQFFGVAKITGIHLNKNTGRVSSVDAIILETWAGSAPEVISFNWHRPATLITEGGRVVLEAHIPKSTNRQEIVFVNIEPVARIGGRDCFLLNTFCEVPEHVVVAPDAGGKGHPLVLLDKYAAAVKDAHD